MNRLSLFTLVAITVFGSWSIVWATDGLRAFNTEARRQIEAREDKPRPDWGELNNQFKLGQKVTIVTFMYTQCRSVCSIASAQFQRLAYAIERQQMKGKIRLLSISFDPVRDTTEVLSSHAKNLNANPDIWHFERLENNNLTEDLLRQLGVTVLPFENGEFEHNAAFYVVNEQGQWVDLYQIDEPELTFQSALRLIES